MSAQPHERPAVRRALDPNSARGRAASAGLAEIFAAVELRKAAKATRTTP